MTPDLNGDGTATDSSTSGHESTGRGPQLSAMYLGDSPDRWRTAGFEVSDDGVCVIGRVQIHCLDAAQTGFMSWAFEGVGATDGASEGPTLTIDGLTVSGEPEVVERPVPTHPNGIVSIDHVVIRTGDCARTTAELERAGFPRRGGRGANSYGSPMSQSFFWAGDVILEVVGPDEGEPTTTETTSIFGLAVVASDLGETGRFLGERMGDPKPAVQPGREIAGLRHKQVGMSLPIAVMSPHRTV